MSTNKMDHDELVEALRSRSPEAMTYLVDNYSGAIFGSISRIVQNEEVAAEVLQDAFMKCWERIDQYDSVKGRFFTWFLNLSRNLAIDRTRSKEIKKAEKTDDLSSFVNENIPGGFTSTSIDAIGLREQLNKLREEERFVLEMAYFRGYTQSEISEEFGIPLGTVKTRLRLALNSLRSALGVK